MPRHLESKSSGALNVIGIFALKLYINNYNLIMKMAEHVTSQSKFKDNEKQNYKIEAI